MKKPIIFLVSGIIALAIYYFISPILLMIIYGHHFEIGNGNHKYLWLFQDSIRKDIDTSLFLGCVRKRDLLYLYSYPNYHHFNPPIQYRISIWEFKDLSRAELDKVSFNTNVNLDNLRPNSFETLNSHLSPEFIIKYGFSFNNNININLNEYSKVYKIINEKNYKGFYGVVNQISFSDENRKHLIFIDYHGYWQEPTLFLLYKYNKRFYVIIINSKKPIDDNTIMILNLKQD
jgi:hypothetical protein